MIILMIAIALPGFSQQPSSRTSATQGSSNLPDNPTPNAADNPSGQQTKRILFIIPNFRSVSADQVLPPQSSKEKFKLMLQDSFDYSAFIYVGVLAGVSDA